MNIFSTGFHLFLILVGLVVWKLSFFPPNVVHSNYKRLACWLLFMFASAFLVYKVLAKWSAPSVRDDANEITFYLTFSMVWIALSQAAFAFLGISVRDDVAERRNVAAGFAVGGLTAGATFCVAASNIGDGPGFEVVLFCAALSTASLFALWALVAQFSGIADAITIDRNVGAGIRAAGWLTGTGLVLGACVAGDWISYRATLKDFVRFGWPVAVAAFLFLRVERVLNFRRESARPSRAVSALAAMVIFTTGALYAHWIARQ